jgi:hypothetical protein
MALYWKYDGGGASGNWTDPTPYWWTDAACTIRAAGIPTNVIDAVFNSNGTGNCVINAGAVCKSLNTTGSVCTISGTTNNFSVYGDVTIGAGTSFTFSGYILILGNMNLTTNAVSLVCNIQWNGSYNLTLLDALTTTKNIQTAAGNYSFTFTSNNYNIKCLLFNITHSAGVKLFALGTSTIEATYANPNAFTFGTAANLTLTGNYTLLCSGISTTFAGGGQTFYDLKFTGTGILTITGSNNFHTGIFSGNAKTIKITAGTTQTFTVPPTMGSTSLQRYIINSSSVGNKAFLNLPWVTEWDYCDLTDIGVTGSMLWAGYHSTQSNCSGLMLTHSKHIHTVL